MALESALHDLRASPRTVRAGAEERPVTVDECVRIESDILLRWARREDRILVPDSFRSRVHGCGAEHAVFLDQTSQRYFKLTLEGGLTVDTEFRIGKRTQRWLGVPFVREATPREYLERLALCNEIFGDDLRFEGVIAEPKQLCLVTSQPVIPGRETTSAEIAAFMQRLGFSAIAGVVAGRHDSASFYRADDRVAVFDAHGENFLTDGQYVAPIDAFIIRADDDLHRFLTLDPGERAAEIGKWISLAPQAKH